MRKVVFAVLLGLLISNCTSSSITVNQRYVDNPFAVEAALNSVVALVERRTDGLSAPICTAFFVGPRLIATAHHCVEVPQYLEYTISPGVTLNLPNPDAEPTIGSEVLFIDHDEHLYYIRHYVPNTEPRTHRATVIQTNAVEDVALLRLADNEPSASDWFVLADTLPRIGESLYEIGMPVGQFWLLTEGMTSSIRELPSGRILIVHQAHVAPGASGGPLFNNLGQVVGVTTAYARDAHYIGFATPINQVQRLIQMPVVMVGEPSMESIPTVLSCENNSCPMPDIE